MKRIDLFIFSFVHPVGGGGGGAPGQISFKYREYYTLFMRNLGQAQYCKFLSFFVMSRFMIACVQTHIFWENMGLHAG